MQLKGRDIMSVLCTKTLPAEETFWVVDPTITIIRGNIIRKVDRTFLEDFILRLTQDFFEAKYIGEAKPKTGDLVNYINAFEWLSFNLYRTAGVELYSDGEIRLNLLLEFTDYNKKCVFLYEAPLFDRDLDAELYSTLIDVMQYHYKRERLN